MVTSIFTTLHCWDQDQCRVWIRVSLSSYPMLPSKSGFPKSLLGLPNLSIVQEHKNTMLTFVNVKQAHYSDHKTQQSQTHF